MWSVHQRMAELWTKQKKKPLTDEEQKEFMVCLEANAKRAWKLAALENLSLVASMSNDIEWQHEICQRIEEWEKSL